LGPPSAIRHQLPDINTLSKTSFSPGDSGTLVIDGENLISPISHTPVINPSSGVFSQFSVTGFSYGDGTITITYKVSDTATPGPALIDVSNGFFSEGDWVTVLGPPVINGRTAPFPVLPHK